VCSVSSTHIIEIDGFTPRQVFGAFANDPYVTFLDSDGPIDARSRFSTLGVMPRRVISVDNAQTPDIWRDLREALAALPLVDHPAIPFCSGAIGFVGYGMAGAGENMAVEGPDPLDLPLMQFGLFDLVFSFDRLTRKVFLISSGDDAKARANRARERLGRGAFCASPQNLCFTPAIEQAAYEEKVAAVLEYIRAGDIYQANFTTRFTAPRPPSFVPSQAYQALLARSPAPFGAYLDLGEGRAIASVSPERFVFLDSTGNISTRPIKGTRPRGASPVEDGRLAHELASSVKDRAENLMIVDLLRNDLARVAQPGSVMVSRLFEIEFFENVIHMVSEIRGKLKPACDAIDLIRAVFPGGSITGAPKIRAQQIIHELESADRGPYCGAIVAMERNGAMDSSIAIRTVSIGKSKIAVNAGGAIVADSVPREEYEEMRLKISPLLRSLS